MSAGLNDEQKEIQALASRSAALEDNLTNTNFYIENKNKSLITI